MILKFSVRAGPFGNDPETDADRQLLGLLDLQVSHDYYLEVHQQPSAAALSRLQAALGDPLTETVVAEQPLDPTRMVQVAYKQGIVDNESDSVVALCQLLGVGALAAKVATTYESPDPALAELLEQHVVNPNIQEVHRKEPTYMTLRPKGRSMPPRHFDLLSMPDAELEVLGASEGRNLNLDLMHLLVRIQVELQLPAITDVLLEAADARWSDHCMHTTWKSLDDLLGQLMGAAQRVENPNVVSMFEDNAGVWEFYEGWAIALKGETHSGPSAVSAYFGQLTKLGGVLRDILGTGLGADPIGVFEYTATGTTDSPAPLPGRPSPRQIARDTVRAIKEYGNTFGVPMMLSHMTFHPGFAVKPFALGGSIGLIPTRDAQRQRAQPGDHVMLIGGLTGNDGIHGASASSAGSEMGDSSVQIGSPLEQVKFRQAIIDLRDAHCLRTLTDVGGAGLNSAVGEIGDPEGIWLNTALVPLKTEGLPTWQILLSESQERMILAVVPERLEAARNILDRHGVRHTVVGRFTRTGRYCVVHLPDLTEDEMTTQDLDALPGDAGTGFDVPYELLAYRPPFVNARRREPPCRGVGEWPSLSAKRLAELAPEILRNPEVASQRYANAQYDTTVMGHTAYGPTTGKHHVPTSFWAATPLAGSPATVIFTAAFNPWLFEIDPVRATRQMFLRAVLKQVLAGVALRDICLCDNFYTPSLAADGGGPLAAMVTELCDLMDALGTPLISGKDSSAGSVATPEGVVSVPPCVFLSAVGKVPDRAQLRMNEWKTAGNVLVRIGPDTAAPGGTVAGRVLGLADSDLDLVDIAAYREFLLALESSSDLISSARPIGPGGVFACLVFGTLASDLGAQLDFTSSGADWLLREHRCGAVVEVPESEVSSLPEVLTPCVLGQVTEDAMSVRAGGVEVARHAVGVWAKSWGELIE